MIIIAKGPFCDHGGDGCISFFFETLVFHFLGLFREEDFGAFRLQLEDSFNKAIDVFFACLKIRRSTHCHTFRLQVKSEREQNERKGK